MVEPDSSTSPLPGIQIAQNLARINERIDRACSHHGRHRDEVRLVAVSKTQPAEAVSAALGAGQIDFGENRIQDALAKIPLVHGDEVQWHFIGPLQSNKTRYLPGNFHWWHTLHRNDIAKGVSSKATTLQTCVETLIQVNLINDPAKSGVSRGELPSLVEQLVQADLTGVRLRGLMTIGPHHGSETAIRRCFSDLRELRDGIREQFSLADFNQLSMGMTGDMEQAIAEGATMVRVGSAIFGPRR